MTGKQITDLDIADNFEEGDLMLVRKSGLKKDKSISKDKLIESIGNTAVTGYTAISEFENRISLTASNRAFVPSYRNGMRISFISPITTTDIVGIKIVTLGYLSLNKYNSEETVQLIKGEYVDAVFTDGIFKQTNNLNTHLVWSNEYVAKAEKAPDASTTTYHLTSAIGVKKPNYYAGMSLLFTVPMTSEGMTLVNVDGLGVKKLGESGGSLIAKDIYKDQAIIAIYDGKEFQKQKFSSIHRTPIVVEPELIVEPDTTSQELEKIIPQAPLEEVDIWSPDHKGNPDDPANVTSPHATNSKGKPIFASIVTVGSKNSMYKTLAEAIAALINDYGEDGGGNLFAIEIQDHYLDERRVEILGIGRSSADYSWISIFMKNNATLNVDKTFFAFNGVKKAPIFNLKLSCTRGTVLRLPPDKEYLRTHRRSPPKYTYEHLEFEYLFKFVNPCTLIFGKNTAIHYYHCTDSTKLIKGVLPIVIKGKAFVEAKYGITIKTNSAFVTGGVFINKGSIMFTGDYFGYLFKLEKCVFNFSATPKSEIHNTEIFSVLNEKLDIFYQETSFTQGNYRQSGIIHTLTDMSLKNVKSSNRKKATIGIKADNCNVEMEDCEFASKTVGSASSGYDIVLEPTYKPPGSYCKIYEVHLKNTTGNTSHIKNKQIYNMIISEE